MEAIRSVSLYTLCCYYGFWDKCEDAFFSANERSKGEGKGEEGKEKGKGEIGSEALAETEKIANAPTGNRTRNPSKRG